MRPNYVATKSAWKAVSFLTIIFFWLIIPLIVMAIRIIILKNERVEFYDNYVIIRWGVLSKNERKSAFLGVNAVSIRQSLLGRMFNYGDVDVDMVGRWDVDLEGISYPAGLKHYLETRYVDSSEIIRTSY